MSPRRKIKLIRLGWISLVLGLVVADSFGLIRRGVDGAVLMAGVLVFGLLALSVRCPGCGKNVTYNPLFGDPDGLWVYTPWVPRKCPRCGYDYTLPRARH
jgi:hypothetical protein